MSFEGRLTIDLHRAGDGRGSVAIASSRPLGLTRAFVGKSADDAVRTLPLLFNVCAMAQGAAAVQACEQALGIGADEATCAVRRLLVHAETLREHLIRAVMDWPRFLGLDADKAEMLRVMRLCEGLKRALNPEGRALTIGGSAQLTPARITAPIEDLARLVETLVIGEATGIWLARRSADDFTSWSLPAATASQRLVAAVLDRGWAGAGRAATRFLPPLDDSDLAARLLGDAAAAFMAAPTWDGMPYETSALARQAECPLVRDVARVHGRSGLLTRIAARLVEMAELPSVMRRVADTHEADVAPATHSSRQQSGRGLAQVEAARGRLVHGVEIEDGIVRRYAVLAPTEWNFHANGGAAHGLADIASREHDAREIADLFVTTVDPCVGYELRVH